MYGGSIMLTCKDYKGTVLHRYDIVKSKAGEKARINTITFNRIVIIPLGSPTGYCFSHKEFIKSRKWKK
jgi:hypothetical protein